MRSVPPSMQTTSAHELTDEEILGAWAALPETRLSLESAGRRLRSAEAELERAQKEYSKLEALVAAAAATVTIVEGCPVRIKQSGRNGWHIEVTTARREWKSRRAAAYQSARDGESCYVSTTCETLGAGGRVIARNVSQEQAQAIALDWVARGTLPPCYTPW